MMIEVEMLTPREISELTVDDIFERLRFWFRWAPSAREIPRLKKELLARGYSVKWMERS